MISLVKATVKKLVSVPTWDRLRGRWWRLSRPLLAEHCPVLLPWFLAPPRNRPIDALHRLSYRFNLHYPVSIPMALGQTVGLLCWPLRLVSKSLSVVRKYGGPVDQVHRVSRAQQLRQLLYYGLRFNMPPTAYYKYRLFLPENGERVRDFLHEDQMDVLIPTLMHGRPSDRDMRDKQRFYEHCRQHNLPAVDIIATFYANAVERWYADTPETLPRTDLVLKPADLACGQGFQRWNYDPERDVWQRGEMSLNRAQLIAQACERSRHRRHLLQACLTNHPVLARFAPVGLCTIRIVSYRRVNGELGVLMTALRMPTGANVVDNFAAGGLAAPIDLATGVVGEAVTKYPWRGPVATHPDTGAAIAGTTIPRWTEAGELALRAHATCPWLLAIGWDIVITETAVCLLEANPGWCVELAQIIPNRPLGATIYPELFLEYLQSQETTLKPAPSALA